VTYELSSIGIIRYPQPEGTYLAWLDCRGLGLGGDPATAFLERAHVAWSSGAGFGSGGEGFVRLNFATSPEILIEAVRRMSVLGRPRPSHDHHRNFHE
jgi:cysteine-S-conjugate beta-lyase